MRKVSNKAAIAFFGSLAGMTSLAADTMGTALTLYLVKMRVSMLAFMGTSTWFVFVMNVIKVPIVVSLGLLTWHTLLVDLFFVPVLVIGALAGVYGFRRINQQVFTTVALLLSSVAAVWLERATMHPRPSSRSSRGSGRLRSTPSA